MADSPSSLAIIIVTYNSADEIGPCLDSLVGRTDPLATTITVVDNASTDGTVDLVRRAWPSVQIIASASNTGFSRANNRGIRATTGDYVLLLNPDTTAPPGAIQALVHALAVRPEAAVAGPRLLNGLGVPELSWGDPLSPWNELKRKVFSSLYHRQIPRIVRMVDRSSRQTREVAWVSGACMLIRRPDLVAVGLLDERYFMYTEDVDLCMAMTTRGRAVVYVADAEVVHHRGRSGAHNPNTARLYRKSQVAYYEKHLPDWAGLLRTYLKLTGKPFTE